MRISDWSSDVCSSDLRMGGVAGNSALPLATTDGAVESDELGGDMRPTPWLQQCPCIMQVMDALGATWGRSRLMRLSGRSQLAAHVDTNYYWQERMRVHVPIVTTPAVRFPIGRAACRERVFQYV